jgi:hypothetical protein
MAESACGWGRPLASRARDGACNPQQDRVAIRAIAGSFAFEEVEALMPGYRLHEPYRATATEVVSILEDSDERLMPQHVLVLTDPDGNPGAMKHWRQDWRFEDRELLEFRAGVHGCGEP